MLGFRKKAAQFGHQAPGGIHGEDKADIDMGLDLLPFGESAVPFGAEKKKHRRHGHGASHHGEFEGSVDGDVSVEDPIADGEDVGPFGDHHIDLPGGSLYEQDDYGQGVTGTGVNNVLGSSGGGGVDPFQVAAFGDDDTPSPIAEFTTDLVSANLEDLASDGGENMSYQPADLDPFDAPDQVPTLRNPVIAFGDEVAGDYYSGFHAAPIMGSEDEDCFIGGMKG